MKKLSQRSCTPCHGGMTPLAAEDCTILLKQLDSNWYINEHHQLQRDYTFTNFVDALAFTNRLGNLAEAEGHHPDLALGWGYVKICLWTHAIQGLSESDFIWAAKLDVQRSHGS